MSRPALDAAIARGLDYLASQQKTNGGFDSFSSPGRDPFVTEHRYQTTFVPALILSSLSSLEAPAAKRLRRRLMKFLLGQKSQQWSFNYWAKSSPQRRSHPYPDDLDDTFCALYALAVHDPAVADEAMLAGAVKILLAAETTPGGPYRTWLVGLDSGDVWLDTDVAVNANINAFLAKVNEPLPQLTFWLDVRIKQKRLQSPYYPSAVPLIYYLARHYHGYQKAALVRQARKLLTLAANELETALLLSALLRLGVQPTEEQTQALIKSQAPDGSWPAAAFCIDPAVDGQTFYHGSAALTTAFVLETLQLSGAAPAPAAPAAKQVSTPAITVHVKRYLNGVTPELRRDYLDFLRRVAQGSSGEEILGLAPAFNDSLIKPLPKTEAVQTLALANLFGWAAYTIYDDFMDEEGLPSMLPVANICHRRALQLFSADQPKEFQAFVAQVFDAIDSANAWELARCRAGVRNGKIKLAALPSFGRRDKLAERSLGHILGPISLLNRAGFAPDSPESQQLQTAMRHYLISRQLNDDAHDWKEDLARGQLTYVATAVLKDAGIKPGGHTVVKMLPRLQKVFWHQTLPALCLLMQKHLAAARRLVAQSEAIKADNILLQLIDKQEALVQKTLASQAQAEKFLKHYKSA